MQTRRSLLASLSIAPVLAIPGVASADAPTLLDLRSTQNNETWRVGDTVKFEVRGQPVRDEMLYHWWYYNYDLLKLGLLPAGDGFRSTLSNTAKQEPTDTYREAFLKAWTGAGSPEHPILTEQSMVWEGVDGDLLLKLSVDINRRKATPANWRAQVASRIQPTHVKAAGKVRDLDAAVVEGRQMLTRLVDTLRRPGVGLGMGFKDDLAATAQKASAFNKVKAEERVKSEASQTAEYIKRECPDIVAKCRAQAQRYAENGLLRTCYELEYDNLRLGEQLGEAVAGCLREDGLTVNVVTQPDRRWVDMGDSWHTGLVEIVISWGSDQCDDTVVMGS